MKLNDLVKQEICNALLLGAYPETAASSAGIEISTLREWLKRGAREKRGQFHEFSVAYKKAIERSQLRDLTRIDTAANTQWQAAAWKLERRDPKRWGVRISMEVRKEQDFFLDRCLSHFGPGPIYEQLLQLAAEDSGLQPPRGLPSGEATEEAAGADELDPTGPA